MNTDSRLPEFALIRTLPRQRSLAPAWWVRLALRWTDQCIARLEGQLGDEFATDATLPMLRELRSLGTERQALVASLADARRG